MLVEGIKNDFKMKYLIIVAASIFLGVLIDEVLKKTLVNYSETLFRLKRNSPGNSFVFLSETVPVHFSDHIDKLFRVVYLNVAEEMT